MPARPDPPGPPQHADPRAPSPIPTQDGDEWIEKLDAIALAAGYNRTLRGARNLEQIVAKLDPSRADILMSQLRPAILQPAYILVRDRVEKKLFFVIRGTHSVRDTVTSLTANSRPHHAIGEDGAPVLGHAHAGFLSTARWLVKTCKNDLVAAKSANPGYTLTVVGHSLGAGTAVLLTQILREQDGGNVPGNPFANVECIAFACPSCLSRELSESCRSFVTTLVSNADIVPYVSFSKVSELQSQIVSAAWEQQVLKKWRETTRALGPLSACAGPRAGRSNLGPSDADAPRAHVDRGPHFLCSVPGSLTCGFGGPPRVTRRYRDGSANGGGGEEGSFGSNDSRAFDVAHLPGAAAGGNFRPRRWLGAQLRSLTRGFENGGKGGKLKQLAGLGGALIAGCVAPRKPARRTSEYAASGDPRASTGRVNREEERESPRTQTMATARAWPAESPSASSAAAREAAAGAALNHVDRPDKSETEKSGRHPETTTGRDPDRAPRADDDPLPQWTAELASARDLVLELDEDEELLARAQGEAAQEVLRLQEELSVIQAAEIRSASRAASTAGGDSESDEEDRSPLAAPKASWSSMASLLGPGAPADVVAAADEVEAAIQGPDEIRPGSYEPPTSFNGGPASTAGGGGGIGEDDDADDVRGQQLLAQHVLAERIATGRGGSDWRAVQLERRASRGSLGGVSENEGAPVEDTAFTVKLYPAGRILHMVRADPMDPVDANGGDGVGDESSRGEDPVAAAPGSAEWRARFRMYADVSVDMYDSIKLSRTMLSDHFLPKYLEALEDVVWSMKKKKEDEAVGRVAERT